MTTNTEKLDECRREFETDAEPLGFDLTRDVMDCQEVDPHTEYKDAATGHRWAGWLAAFELHEQDRKDAERYRYIVRMDGLDFDRLLDECEDQEELGEKIDALIAERPKDVFTAMGLEPLPEFPSITKEQGGE